MFRALALSYKPHPLVGGVIDPIDLLSLLSSLLRSGLTDENALGLVSAGLIATLACASRCCHQVLGILMATHGLFL